MTRLPQYVHRFRDRHGRIRHYFRRRGFKPAALPGLPYSVEFMAAYQAALSETPPSVPAGRVLAGTVNAAIVSYFASAAFNLLAPNTRRTRRYILEQFRREHGDKPIARMQREHVARFAAARAPIAARAFVQNLRALMVHCWQVGMVQADPTQGIRLPPSKSDGYHTWTEEEIAAFELRHKVGSPARLALALLLFTAQRRGDVVRMGRQHVRDGAIRITQQKTGADLAIPIRPELAAIIDATPSGNLTFLVTRDGTPFTPASFGNLFRRWCNEAGLPHCSAHGLRKAACRRLAEAGCSASEIMAISGHASLREVQRYTAAVDQARMARSAFARLDAFPQEESGTSSGKP